MTKTNWKNGFLWPGFGVVVPKGSLSAFYEEVEEAMSKATPRAGESGEMLRNKIQNHILIGQVFGPKIPDDYEVVFRGTEKQAENYKEDRMNKENDLDTLYITRDLFDGLYEVVRIK